MHKILLNLVVRVERNKVDKVDSFKYLGLYLDPCLSWQSHINNLEIQIARLCGIMWRIRKFVPRHALLKFYFAYIHSRISYLVSVWGQSCKSFLSKLETLQNRCLKTIFNKPLLYPTELLYADRSHSILPLSSLCDLKTLLLVHDILHNQNTHHNLALPTVTHSYATRNSNNLQRACMSTILGQRRFSFIGPTKFNLLPSEIKSIQSRHIFKARLKQHLKT